jgi:hypothetical protein
MEQQEPKKTRNPRTVRGLLSDCLPFKSPKTNREKRFWTQQKNEWRTVCYSMADYLQYKNQKHELKEKVLLAAVQGVADCPPTRAALSGT